MVTSFAGAVRTITKTIWDTRVETLEEKTSEVFPGTTGRKLLQSVGTKIREVDENAWVRYVQIDIMGTLSRLVVISDVRYSNEAAICDEVWRVKRDKLVLKGEEASHISEVEMDTLNVDAVLDNNGSVEDLQREADVLCEHLLTKIQLY